MAELLLIVPNRASVGLLPVWRRVSRCVVVGLMVWLAVPLVTELLVRVVSALLAQMVLVPQVLPDRLDMVLLVRNLVFAVLLRLVALLVHPVTALLDGMVQQVPMVVVVSVLKVVERLLMVPNRVSVALPPVWRRVS